MKPILKPIVTFEATLPHSGDWLKVGADEAKVTLIVDTKVAAVLASKTHDLAGKTFVVAVSEEREK